MKKNFLKFLFIPMLLVPLTSCSILQGLFGGNGNGNNGNGGGNNQPDNNVPAGTDVTITIKDGDKEATRTVTTNKENQIEELLKPGFGCKGYFDAPEGGTKYFEGDGTGTGFWSDNYPTTLYAQWKPISEIEISATYGSEPKQFDHNVMYARKITEQLETPMIRNAMKANGSNQIVANYSFYASESDPREDWSVYVKSEKGYNEGSLNSEGIANRYQGIVIYPTTTLQPYSHSARLSCRDVLGGGFYFYFSRGFQSGYGRLSDLVFNLHFE